MWPNTQRKTRTASNTVNGTGERMVTTSARTNKTSLYMITSRDIGQTGTSKKWLEYTAVTDTSLSGTVNTRLRQCHKDCPFIRPQWKNTTDHKPHPTEREEHATNVERRNGKAQRRIGRNPGSHLPDHGGLAQTRRRPFDDYLSIGRKTH